MQLKNARFPDHVHSHKHTGSKSAYVKTYTANPDYNYCNSHSCSKFGYTERYDSVGPVYDFNIYINISILFTLLRTYKRQFTFFKEIYCARIRDKFLRKIIFKQKI